MRACHPLMTQGYSEVKLGKGDEELWILSDQLLTFHDGSIGDEVHYRSTCLMLQLVFFCLCFLLSWVFTEHFCGFGAYYACFFFFWSIWIWCFFFIPLRIRSFFLVCCTLTRFMRMSENRDLSDKFLRYSLLFTYVHSLFYFAGTAFRSCLILQFFVITFVFDQEWGYFTDRCRESTTISSFTNDTFKIRGKRKIMTWTTDWSYGR